MEIPYKIVRFIEDTGQIQIVCDGVEGPPILVDLPVNDGKYLEGDELFNYIRGFIPTQSMSRKEYIKRGISNSDYIANLVEETEIPDNFNNEDTIAENNTKFYNKRGGLLSRSDWIMLEDSPFSEKKKQEWKEYRQALRDLPKNQEIAPDMIWPEQPSYGYY